MTNDLGGVGLRRELLRREELKRDSDLDRELDVAFGDSGSSCCNLSAGIPCQTNVSNLKDQKKEEKMLPPALKTPAASFAFRGCRMPGSTKTEDENAK